MPQPNRLRPVTEPDELTADPRVSLLDPLARSIRQEIVGVVEDAIAQREHRLQATQAADVRLLTVKEVAARWRCHPDTVRKAIKAGALPARMLGNTHLVDPVDLLAYEATRAVVPADHKDAGPF